MPNQRRVGVILGYGNIIVKNLVNLVYTPMLLSFVGQADYGVYQSCNSFVFSLTLLSFGFSQAYVRFYTQRKINGTEEDIRRLNGVYLVLYAVVSATALALGLIFAAVAGIMVFLSFDELLPAAGAYGSRNSSTCGMTAGMAVMAVSTTSVWYTVV